MRRKEKEITSVEEMDAVINDCDLCRVAMVDGDSPYVVAMNFGYRDGAVYLHCATEGRKLDILRTNPKVCVLFDTDYAVTPGNRSCKWGMRYRSVMAFGTAAELTAAPEREAALDALMDQYGGSGGDYHEAVLKKTTVLKITIDSMTGKQSGQDNG